MKHTKLPAFRLCCFLLLLMLAGCSKDDNSGSGGKKNFIDAYGGSPFRGTSKGILVRNDNSSLTWNGKGTVVLTEAEADSVSMIFRADFGNAGSVNFKLRGQQQGMNYLSGDPNASHFRIADNKISGRVSNTSQEMTFEGNGAPGKVFMTMHVTFKEEMDGFPKGSVLTISFDTSRDLSDENDGEGCQMRLVPIWSPSGMTMGMVPDCD